MTWKLHLPTSKGSGSHLTETTRRHRWVRRTGNQGKEGRRDSVCPRRASLPWWLQGLEGTKCWLQNGVRGQRKRKGIYCLCSRHCFRHIPCIPPASLCSSFLHLLHCEKSWEVRTFTISFAKWIMARVRSVMPIRQPTKPMVSLWHFGTEARFCVGGNTALVNPWIYNCQWFLCGVKVNLAFF